jgi:hypothetical protein
MLCNTPAGIVEPIRVELSFDRGGVGKSTERDEYHELSTAYRRLLESEREETQDLLQQRQVRSVTYFRFFKGDCDD